MQIRLISDHFSRLGILQTTDLEEIKKAYRKKCKEAHPDSGGNEADFNRLSESYKECIDFCKGIVKPRSEADLLFMNIWEQYMFETEESVMFSNNFNRYIGEKITGCISNLKQTIEKLKARKAAIKASLEKYADTEDASYMQKLAFSMVPSLLEKIDATVAANQSAMKLQQECLDNFKLQFKAQQELAQGFTFSYTVIYQ